MQRESQVVDSNQSSGRAGSHSPHCLQTVPVTVPADGQSWTAVGNWGGGRESARTDQKLYSAFLAEKGKNERQNTPFFL